ncbi:hypothetical protein JXM67_05770 [candidate division WOR-3 bacterium]|nr:hypothetical protein [candidate division WOR-3 bacterium]
MQQSEQEVASVRPVKKREKCSEKAVTKRRERHDKIAVIGAGPIARIIFKAILGAVGKLHLTRFFETEEEAFVWVKTKDVVKTTQV